MKAAWIRAAVPAAFALSLAALALAFAAPAAAGTPAKAQEDELSALIDRHLRSGGSWFTPGERAVIERKCGYTPGTWDGFEANMSDGAFTCRDGRVVDDAEIRAVLEAAGPRIGARVEAAMARPDVRAAIARVAEAAAARALAEAGKAR